MQKVYNNSVIKNIWLKHKRILLIIFAVFFLVALFSLKTTTVFKNTETYQSAKQENGLIYNNITIEDLVNKDADGDGILDWEESLYGLDPTKKETTPGIPDNSAINKLKSRTDQNEQGLPLLKNSEVIENLTQTDKFSRELFATVAAASQNGIIDQATIDALSVSLADRIQNSPPRKIFLIFDIKIIDDNTVQAFTNYDNALNSIFEKYKMSYRVVDVLQKFIIDENNVDVSILTKLDPIIKQLNKIIDASVKISVPQSISDLHLNVINAIQRLVENLNDIKLYDTDPIMTVGAISQYENNSVLLESATKDLTNAIEQKLNN